MDIERYYNTSKTNDRTSLATLQQQSAFKLDVDVQKGEKIIGAFGKTFYKAKWIDQEESPVVLVEIKGKKASTEAILYITLHHPHIIETYGLVEPNNHIKNSDSILLLQEYAEDGDLSRLLSERYFIPSQFVLLEIFIQISSAMIYLSQNDIIHGDLACRNVLVFKSHPHEPKRNLVKLIDFGLTRDNSTSLDSKIDIPVRYVALEILLSKGRSGYSEKSEVYSFAVLIHEACSFGKIPYEYIDNDEEVCQRKLQGERLTRPEKCDPNIWKLMTICWNDQPNKRPNFQMIHTQLKNIQNIESPSTLSNSILSSSPITEENPCSFQIKYKTCADCGLRYTDYDSHLNNCSEQDLTCFKCGKQYRRANYDNHTKNCDGLSDATINVPSSVHDSSSEDLDQEDLSSCQFCHQQYYKYELDTHQRNCRGQQRYSKKRSPSSRVSTSSRNDENRHQRENNSISMPPPISNRSSSRPNINISEKSSSIPPASSYDNRSFKKPERPFVQKNLSKSTIVQLPCEICNRLIDESQLKTHQKQCDENDRYRIKNKEREIAKGKSIEEAQCQFCNKICLVTELDKHEDICHLNPKNVPDKLPTLSLTRSISTPDFRSVLPLDNSSKSSNESVEISNNQDISRSVISLETQKSNNGKTKPSSKNNEEPPSRFRNFISRLWAFKKK